MILSYEDPAASFTAFNGVVRVSSGSLQEVVIYVKALAKQEKQTQILIFNDRTGEVVDFDFRGSTAQILERASSLVGKPREEESSSAEGEVRRPGRPKLGVVAREVTLLPRHWDWLATQPGGASVALRKMVEHATKANREKEAVRLAREAAFRFASAMAGNERGFEDAIRALFKGESEKFKSAIKSWPIDIRNHVERMADRAFAEPENALVRDPRPSTD